LEVKTLQNHLNAFLGFSNNTKSMDPWLARFLCDIKPKSGKQTYCPILGGNLEQSVDDILRVI
jgi:hypothetical protein